MSGLASTVAQGFAFGSGSAIARAGVDAVLGGGSSSQPQQAAPAAADHGQSSMLQDQMNGGACMSERQIYYDCLRDNKDDGAVCQFLMEQLKACNQNQMYS